MRIRIRIVFVLALTSIGVPELAHVQDATSPSHFRTSDACIACHSNLVTNDGRDVSIGYAWRASMMANSARDPYWHAAVRREVTDNPSAQAAIEDKCSTCHMPIARFDQVRQGGHGEVFANIYVPGDSATSAARDGVSCTVCHQITGGNFGLETSFTGGFEIDVTVPRENRPVYAGHDVDAGRQRVMQSASSFLPSASPHLQLSEMCATCHTLYTHALDDSGREVGELAEQVPYLEWLHSDYRTTASCQDCHMPALEEETAITSVLGQPRPQFSQHVFRGGNFFMLGVLNKHRGELGVLALPQELEAAIGRTRSFLSTETATVEIEDARLAGDRLSFDVVVSSLAGHKLPTAYPSRRVWLHVRVEDARGNVVFESGRVGMDGAIVGNDNDMDATRFEPHYDLIERPDEVQIYEPILGDAEGAVTTALLRGVGYLKDNRILPRGFDKRTADPDVGVFGRAADDPDFAAGSDRVTYRIPVGSSVAPTTIRVSLNYQGIGFRWAENLGQYRSFETDRFTRYYAESIADGTLELAGAEAHIAN